MSLIEDETNDSYTIRTDKLEDGEILQCRDDNDMRVKKEGDSIVLIKKCFKNNVFIKC